MSLPHDIEVGKKYKFSYPPQFVTLPEYTARAGSIVTVIRPLTEDEAENGDDFEQMFKVRCEDGWEGDAFASELEPEWSGSPAPEAPDDFWVDDATGEYVRAPNGPRMTREEALAQIEAA